MKTIKRKLTAVSRKAEGGSRKEKPERHMINPQI
jgi:hypothetical protein